MPDSSTRILAIRHGETAWNLDTRIQGHLDIGLNATGRWQAERLGRALADEPISAVYSSDLSRAFDTAQAVAGAVGLQVKVDPGLRERAFGVFQGQTFDEITARWPDEGQRWRKRDPDFAPEGGESLVDFYERCVGTAQQLAARHPGKTIALVAHGGVMDCFYRAATRLPLQAPRSWLVTNASINRLLYTGEGFTLVGWADNTHLEGADRARDETSDGVLASDARADMAGPAA